jgi:diadenosine tetraphosphate (Ap4A) HIT family hydrolase
MRFDPSCFYCVRDHRLDGLMIEIAALEVSSLFLFREQTYRGRCLVAFRDHARELYELAAEELQAFARDVSRAAGAVAATVAPDKLNYGVFADKLGHLHVHLVPKVRDGRSWGGMFEMSPEPAVRLPDAEYEGLAARIRSRL